jgi:LL-diaminopimelate aminotransferase
MTEAKRLNTVNEYYFSQKLRQIDEFRAAGKPIINLGIGSPDMPPHESVIEALHSHSAKHSSHGYQSYKGILELRQAIAQWYHTWYNVQLDAANEILPLLGSKEGIMHVCMAFFEDGDMVLVPNPGYPTYASAIQLSGATALNYNLLPENNWQPDLVELEKQIQVHRPKGMFLNTPHMPTGTSYNNDTLLKLIQLCTRHNVLLIHDNPYSFILNDAPKSLLAIEGAKDIAIELNTLSKSHNMAGWRVGMMLGKKEFINTVLKFKSNMDSGMFYATQMAAVTALQLPKSFHNEVNENYEKRKAVVNKILSVWNISAEPQQGLFVWASIPVGYENDIEFSDDILLNKNVFITPGSIFGTNGKNYFRISLCNTVEVLEKALAQINE